MVKFSKHVFLVGLAVCLCNFGCTPNKKIDASLHQPLTSVVSSSEPSSAASSPLFAELTLDVYAYPKAIATQEDIVFGAEDSLIKRNAYLTLTSLHMNRVNPNQDFWAASVALEHAVELDPSLLGKLSIQRWLDVFSLLSEIREGQERAGQLQLENEKLSAAIKKQKYTINYLEKILEELKRVELDVAEKKRFYR